MCISLPFYAEGHDTDSRGILESLTSLTSSTIVEVTGIFSISVRTSSFFSQQIQQSCLPYAMDSYYHQLDIRIGLGTRENNHVIII